MRTVSPFILFMLVVSGVVDLAGFAFGLFYAGVFYDNLAHFLTSFSLVALAAELYAPRREKFFYGGRRALAAGALAALAGGVAWEVFEDFLDSLFPATIYNPPLDSVVDTAFGMLGGALGAWTITHLRRSSEPPHI